MSFSRSDTRSEPDLCLLDLAVDFDEDRLGSVDHDVGDVVKQEQRIEGAIPPRVAELQANVALLSETIKRLEAIEPHAEVDRSPALSFPGMKHTVEDGRPGGLVTVRFRPAQWVRADCRPGTLAAYMVDADEMWHSVDVDLVQLPTTLETQDIAFGVYVPTRMAVGRAQLLIQITQDCGTHVQVDSSPRLQFRVLAPAMP